MSNAVVNEVKVGTIVAETYVLVRILGRGGMGTVWEADHVRLPGKQVAIKILHASVAKDSDSLARFRREAEIACRLGHPNIVEVHDFNFLDDGSPYLILELLEGEDLESRLRKGVLSIQECEHILRQIGSALQSSHAQGVIHRDLKPQNIFLVPSPTGVGPNTAKVLDFGISKIHGSQTIQTQDTTLLGTPQYMAPEQARGEHDKVDARTDLFALAAMFYELLTGKPAFGGKSIPEVVYKVVHSIPAPLAPQCPELSSQQVAAISKALSKEQSERFTDISQFVEAFTGSPLPLTRNRRLSNAPDMAMAQTMDSASVSFASTVDSKNISPPASALDSTDIAQAATMASQNAPIVVAQTLDSKNAQIVVAQTLDSKNANREEILPSSEANHQTTPTHSQQRPATTIRYILILTVLSLTAVVVYVLTRPGNNTTKLASVEEAPPLSSFDAATSIDATIVDAPLTDAAPPPDAQLNKTTFTPSTAINTTSKKKPNNPPVFYELLDIANKAIRAGNGRAAARATEKAKRHGTSSKLNEIDAKAYCLLLDLTRANSAIRRVKRSRKKGIRKFCSAHGLEIAQ